MQNLVQRLNNYIKEPAARDIDQTMAPAMSEAASPIGIANVRHFASIPSTPLPLLILLTLGGQTAPKSKVYSIPLGSFRNIYLQC